MQKVADWQMVFKDYRASGLVQRQFCQQHDLDYWAFRYHWRKQGAPSNAVAATKAKSMPPFEVVTVKQDTVKPVLEKASLKLLVQFPNHIRCELPIAPASTELLTLLSQLVRLC